MTRPPRRLGFVLGVVALAGVVAMSSSAANGQTPPAQPTLLARAVLPADTFADGPPSGARVDPMTTNGRMVPFPRQPVQGMSAVLENGDGTFMVMQDKGFGAKANSPDINLRVYTVRPNWKTRAGGPGTVDVVRHFELSDPDRLVPFPITNQNSPTRILTGGDFDIESMRRTPDGTLWFGDEFGPYLLHTDATGKLIDSPIALPVPQPLEFFFFMGGATRVQSPDNPAVVPLADAAARNNASNLSSSRGFEGMALSADGRRLYPLLEGALKADPNRTRLVVSEFDLQTRQDTGLVWYYRLESDAHARRQRVHSDPATVAAQRHGEAVAAGLVIHSEKLCGRAAISSSGMLGKGEKENGQLGFS
jgi:hypothetical protein